MSEEDKSCKRTFGLVSGYGSDTESEESEAEEVTKKQKVGDDGEIGVTEDKNEDEEERAETKAPSLSWMRARREYEERSMMYSFICSTEDDEKESGQKVNDETDEQKVEANGGEKEKIVDDRESDRTKVPAAEREEDSENKEDTGRDISKESKDEEVISVEKNKEVPVENKDKDNCETGAVENEDKVVVEKSDTEVKTVIDNHERDWEIQAIQAEIEAQQKDWEPVYSDDEGTGAEDAAAYKIAKKRAAIMKDVEKEMVRPMNRPAAKILPENHVPGEGWKRLQLRAETRVKNFPELYQTYPVHKFPLKD